MIDRGVALLLIGTALGLASAIIGALVQHFLSLRADRIKRGRDREEKEAAERKRRILQGTQLSKDIMGIRDLEEALRIIVQDKALKVELEAIKSQLSEEDKEALQRKIMAVLNEYLEGWEEDKDKSAE